MKWLSIISVLALAFVFNACEMHPASDAPGEEVKEFGKYEKGGEEKEKTEAKPAAGESAAKPEAAATPEAKKGDAPKYFPESK